MEIETQTVQVPEIEPTQQLEPQMEDIESGTEIKPESDLNEDKAEGEAIDNLQDLTENEIKELADMMDVEEIATAPRELKAKRTRSKNNVEKRSEYFGVHWSKSQKKWQASRTLIGKTINGGYFEDELDAAKRSDALVEQYGPTSKAKRNFDKDGNRIVIVPKPKKVKKVKFEENDMEIEDKKQAHEPRKVVRRKK